MARSRKGVTFWDRVAEKTVAATNGCELWTGCKDECGYGRINRDGRVVRIHREVWKERHGRPIPRGFSVCHTCDNPNCINPDHLWLGTHAENMADMKAKGRQRFFQGQRHPRAKLSNEQVHAIRAATGLQKEIARDFGVSQQLVSYIRRREGWRHI